MPNPLLGQLQMLIGKLMQLVSTLLKQLTGMDLNVIKISNYNEKHEGKVLN